MLLDLVLLLCLLVLAADPTACTDDRESSMFSEPNLQMKHRQVSGKMVKTQSFVYNLLRQRKLSDFLTLTFETKAKSQANDFSFTNLMRTVN